MLNFIKEYGSVLVSGILVICVVVASGSLMSLVLMVQKAVVATGEQTYGAPVTSTTQAIVSAAGFIVGSSGLTNSTTLTQTGVATFNAQPVMNAGVLLSYTLATSTPASMTLKASDLLNYTTVIVTPTGAAADKTFTFPASSTLSAMVPSAGDRFSQCWINSTTTAATTITFAAGTGIDLEVASSTGSAGGPLDLTVSANGMACLEYVRGPATASTFDIHVGVTEYNDAD